jgi:YD repeat-containing protein
MKPLAPYFGNRFATVAGKKTKKAQKAASEMEALESRLLLSGITAGSKVLKSYNFVDADGDKVSIKLTGKVAKGAGFQVDGLGNGFDVNEINLVGNLGNNNLVVNVTPVKLAPSDRTTANQLYTAGYTNIATITRDGADGTIGAGSTAIKNIALNAAVVGDISLAGADITGAINLGIGKTAFVDRINTASPTTPGSESSYVPSVGFIDLYDVSAKSIGLITVNGTGAAATTGNLVPGYTPSNDLLGSITVSGNLGGITGVRSDLAGTVDVGGNLGKVNVGDLSGTLSAGGNITIILPDGSDATISAGKHLNVAWRGNTLISSANLIAGEGISGLATSTSDDLILGSKFDGTLTNTGAAFGISNIVVRGGVSDNFTATSAGAIGNISAIGLAGVTLTASGGNIGAITATAGQISGSITASGNIGAITVDGGTLSATVVAGGSIGAIDADNTGDAISGSFVAGTSITSITAKTVNGAAITGLADFTAGTFIGDISATATANGEAISKVNVEPDPLEPEIWDYADFIAGTTIGKIDARGSVTAATFDADGAIGAITVTDGSLSNGDFAAKVTSGTSVGAVNIAGDFSGSITTIATGTLTGGAIGAVTVGGEMSGDLTAAADTAANASIGVILVGGGIVGSQIDAGGAIESITVSSLGIDATAAITAGSITNALAVTGNMKAAVTTNVGGIGSISITEDVDNVQAGDVTAAIISETSIGSISISGNLTNNITAGTTIGAIEITGDLGDAIGDTINAQSGNIASVTVGGDLVGKVDVDNGAIAGVVNVSGALEGIILVENDTKANATIGAITIGEGIDASAAHTAINAEGAVASITVSANGIQADGAPTVISVGSITGVLSVTGNIVDKIATTVGGIGSITVLADADAPQDGDVSANITSVGNIGVIAIDGKLSSTIQATEGDVNNITVGSVSGASIIAGNNGGTADDAGTIGNITITGDLTVDQTITLDAFEVAGVGGIIGDIVATGFSVTNRTLDITVGINAVEIGSIEVENADVGETANISVDNTGGQLAAIGNITADGNVNFNDLVADTLETIGDLAIEGALSIDADQTNIVSIGTFDVGSIVQSTGAGITIGGSGATIGYVTIGSDVATNAVQFDFTDWTMANGTVKAGNDNTAVFLVGIVDGVNLNTGTGAGELDAAGGINPGGGDLTFVYIA